MFTCVLLLLTVTAGYRAKEVISPYRDVTFATESENVNLSCKYTGSVRSLHWYRQYAASPPQFLILDYSGSIIEAVPPVSGISIEHRNTEKSVDLMISSVKVTDSALYYCVPFERIGMDLIGPLERSAQGHRFPLVIVDYATRYPEAVALRNISATSVSGLPPTNRRAGRTF
ncbi:tyrosine-protein phosphatase non-receptor type substrate 1-like [Triplophysa dalaica]|uniref:tyrosine-protein phosphatase non-receptor type substrate 1-like n=1 Tax=Triplophysa dalaica TaxID=1582913 RepID=UPI0024DF59C9|nr:tyrosine-protein phosphatase non-receptor type substrate 1-like [Triplophysa dalaica]